MAEKKITPQSPVAAPKVEDESKAAARVSQKKVSRKKISRKKISRKQVAR